MVTERMKDTFQAESRPWGMPREGNDMVLEDEEVGQRADQATVTQAPALSMHWHCIQLLPLMMSDILEPVSIHFKISSGNKILGADHPPCCLPWRRVCEGREIGEGHGRAAPALVCECRGTVSVNCISSGLSQAPFHTHPSSPHVRWSSISYWNSRRGNTHTVTCTNRVISAVGDEHTVFALLDADTFQSLAYSPPVASDSFLTLLPWPRWHHALPGFSSSASEPRVLHLWSGDTMPALLGSR